MNEETTSYELPEETREEIIDKIEAMAWMIRDDWSDPRDELREIVRLCTKLKAKITT